MQNKLFRCSSLHLILGQSKTKGEVLSQTAKSAIRAMVKEDLYGHKSFKGSKYTSKGILLEEKAIELIGNIDFIDYEKNKIRFNSDLITGEPDVIHLPKKVIIDTKVTWDIGTHPFFTDEAIDKVKKSGYDIQQLGYMYLLEKEFQEKFDHAEVRFCLFPTPDSLVTNHDEYEAQYEMIEAIPQEKRVKKVIVPRDESVFERIEEVIPYAQRYYKKLMLELIEND